MESLEIAKVVDVGLRVYLIGFIGFLVMYRDQCLGGFCMVHKQKKRGVFLRIVAGAIATIGFFVPVAGAGLSIVLVVFIWSMQHGEEKAAFTPPAKQAVAKKVDGVRSRRGVPIGRES